MFQQRPSPTLTELSRVLAWRRCLKPEDGMKSSSSVRPGRLFYTECEFPADVGQEGHGWFACICIRRRKFAWKAQCSFVVKSRCITFLFWLFLLKWNSLNYQNNDVKVYDLYLFMNNLFPEVIYSLPRMKITYWSLCLWLQLITENEAYMSNFLMHSFSSIKKNVLLFILYSRKQLSL